jgi:DNA-binding winged helix-turn-helix (wHTH) protein
MTYPFSVTAHPDDRFASATVDPVLGREQRRMLGVMVRRPGHVLSTAEMCAGLSPTTARNPRRIHDLISGLRRALGEDAIVHVPRRGWIYVPAAG